MRTVTAIVATAAFLATGIGSAAAQQAQQAQQARKTGDLKSAVEALVQNHKRVKAAEADLASNREKIRVSLGKWFPTFDLTGNYGYEVEKKGQGVADTHLPPREVDLKLTQLLWDFGSTNAAVAKARLTFEQSLATRDATRQSVVLEGVTAYLELLKSARISDFARGSEANVKRQSELEDSKVARGAGFSTDVLQAKTQLAGAESRRIEAEGKVRTSRNRYRAVFYDDPVEPKDLKEPVVPFDLLPAKIEDAVEIAYKENPQLKASRLSAEIAREDVNKTLADEFLPTLNGVGEWKQKEDVQGTIGGKTEKLVKVELTYKFNMGFTAVNSLRAAEQTHSATDSRYGDARDQVEEQVRNSWESLQTAKSNADALRNQANIAAEFLELARKERALGTRSLIDVLSGETSLINASSDAAAAETDIAIAVFRLLSAMGRLQVEAIR